MRTACLLLSGALALSGCSSPDEQPAAATPAGGEPEVGRPATPSAAPRPHAGNEVVAAAVRELDTVAQRPLAEHPDAFARVHAGLQQALSDIDDA